MNNEIFEFNPETSKEVRDIITDLYHSKKRVKITYGDIATGKSWHEENDVYGRIGRSTGTKPIPLLVYNKCSTGGASLLAHCILKIEASSKPHSSIYKHPLFKPSKFEIKEAVLRCEDFAFELHIDGKFHSRHKTQESACKLIVKLS